MDRSRPAIRHRFSKSVLLTIGALLFQPNLAAKNTAEPAPVFSLVQLSQFAETDRQFALQQAETLLHSDEINAPLQQLDLMLFIVKQHYRLGQFTAARQMIDTAYPLAQELGQSEVMAHLKSLEGLILYQHGALSRAISALDESEQIAQQSGNGKGIVRARLNKGLIYREGYFDPAKALELNMETLALAQEFHYGKGVSYLLNNLGEALLDIGVTDLALEYVQESIAQKQMVGDTAAVANSLRVVANIYNRTNQPQQALQTLEQALALVDGRTHPRWVARILAERAATYRLLGQRQQAEASYQQAVSLFEKTHDQVNYLASMQQLAQFYLQAGRLDECQQWLTKSETLLASVPDLQPGRLGVSQAMLDARLLLKLAKPQLARQVIDNRLFDHSIDVNIASEPPLYELAAKIAFQLGQPDTAYQQLSLAHQLSKQAAQLRNQQLLASMQTIFRMRQRQDSQHQRENQAKITNLQAEKQLLLTSHWLIGLTLVGILLLLAIYQLSRRFSSRKLETDSGQRHIDQSSGLHNRNYTAELMPALLRHDRESGRGKRYSMLLFKIHNLAKLLATRGADEQQQLLQSIASEISKCCRQGELLARWSNESFLLIYRDGELANIEALASEILACIQSMAADFGGQTRLKGSVGIVHCTSTQLNSAPGSSWMDMVNIADICLYAAQRSADNGWVGIDVSLWKKGTRYLLNLFSDSPDSCINYAGIELSSSLTDLQHLNWQQPKRKQAG